MNTYISKLISTIPASQRSAIQALVASENAKAGGKTLTDIILQIQAISKDVSGYRPQAFIEPFPSSFKRIGSKNINDFIALLKLDLGTIYNELDNIAMIYEQLSKLNESDQRSIERQLRSLDDMLTLVEILDEKEQDHYSSSSYNTFSSSNSMSLDYAHNLAPTLYIDPLTSRRFNSNNLLGIDIAREGATLPIENIKYYDLNSIYVAEGSNTTISDYDFTLDTNGIDSRPENMVSNLLETDNTIWAHFVFLSKTYTRQKPAASTSTELILDLQGLAAVNTITLAPATAAAITITTISYEGADGEIYIISDSNFTLNSETSINFSKKIASKIYIQFSQNNFIRLQTSIDNDKFSPYVVLPQKIYGLDSSPGIEGIKRQSAFPATDTSELNGWLYTFGLDKLRVGLATYKDYGIFVSDIVSINGACHKMAVNVNISTSLDAVFNPGESIEYWIHKFDQDKSGDIVNTQIYPVLPLGTANVAHEQLVINQSGIGSVRFFPNMDEDFKVYRNFTELTIGVDYTVSADLGVTYEDALPTSMSPVGLPYKLLINIVNPQSNNLYTVSYTPKFFELSSGYPLYLDSSGTGVLAEDGSIVLSYSSSQENRIIKSEFALVIIIRSLNHQQFFRDTPIIFDYTLFGG